MSDLSDNEAVNFIWVQWNIKDYISGTCGMTGEQEGIYNRILSRLYDRGKPLPDDDAFMARLLFLQIRVYRRIKLDLVSMGKLKAKGGCLTNDRFEKERRKRAFELRRSSDAAHRRWAKTKESGVESLPETSTNLSENFSENTNEINGISETPHVGSRAVGGENDVSVKLSGNFAKKANKNNSASVKPNAGAQEQNRDGAEGENSKFRANFGQTSSNISQNFDEKPNEINACSGKTPHANYNQSIIDKGRKGREEAKASPLLRKGLRAGDAEGQSAGELFGLPVVKLNGAAVLALQPDGIQISAVSFDTIDPLAKKAKLSVDEGREAVKRSMEAIIAAGEPLPDPAVIAKAAISSAVKAPAGYSAEAAFEKYFWPTYPRKKDRAKALAAWKKLNYLDQRDAYKGLMRQKTELEAANQRVSENGSNCCIYPERWLKWRRWEDECDAIVSDAIPMSDDEAKRMASIRSILKRSEVSELADETL